MTMTNEELAEAKTRTVPSGAIVIAAKAMHDRGRELGWFAREWECLPEDSKERYETLASAAIAQLWAERDRQRAVIERLVEALAGEQRLREIIRNADPKVEDYHAYQPTDNETHSALGLARPLLEKKE